MVGPVGNPFRGREIEEKRISEGEIRKQLEKMARKKAADGSGVVVEMLQAGGEELLEAIAETYNELMKEDAMVPSDWMMTRLIVIFKKGDQSMPENYRPIAILPIVYKLFSRILCERVKGMLNGAQTCDQAGFRSGYSCDDHLFAITMMIEISLEWNQPLWVAAIDFKRHLIRLNMEDCGTH